MNLLEAENAIKTRLEAQIKATATTDFDAPIVDSFPKDPVQHFENINPQGEILVIFAGAVPTIPEPNREGVVVQDVAIDWVVSVVMPNLTSHTGIYNWIEKVKDALTGWHIGDDTDAGTEWDNSGPMYCTNIQFIEEQGGIWYYEMTFQHILEESET